MMGIQAALCGKAVPVRRTGWEGRYSGKSCPLAVLEGLIFLTVSVLAVYNVDGVADGSLFSLQGGILPQENGIFLSSNT